LREKFFHFLDSGLYVNVFQDQNMLPMSDQVEAIISWVLGGLFLPLRALLR